MKGLWSYPASDILPYVSLWGIAEQDLFLLRTFVIFLLFSSSESALTQGNGEKM